VLLIELEPGAGMAPGAATGQVRWTYTTASRVFSSPAVAGSAVYVGSGDDNVYALSAGPMSAVIVAANDQ
jgi:outer membrane protein assembly factor BamB